MTIIVPIRSPTNIVKKLDKKLWDTPRTEYQIEWRNELAAAYRAISTDSEAGVSFSKVDGNPRKSAKR